jgi:hypothetical protein
VFSRHVIASCQPPGAQNFEVVARFLENLCTPAAGEAAYQLMGKGKHVEVSVPRHNSVRTYGEQEGTFNTHFTRRLYTRGFLS